MIRVAIADDHALVRDGLRRTLGDDPQIVVVGEADSSSALLELLGGHEVDVALVDVSMPGIGFLELLRRLREDFPQVHAVVVSAHEDEEYVVRALKAGAKGYVDKSRSGAELIEAVRRAARGATYLTEAQSSFMVKELRAVEPRSPESALSEREYQVLGLLGSGKSIKEIAALLGVSIKTVSTYRTRLLEKLGRRTTADLIRYAVERGLTG